MDIIALVNAEGFVTYVSPSITPIMGYQPEEFVGSSALVLVHPSDLDHMQQVFGAVLQEEGQPIRAEYRLRSANGTYRWFEATATNWLRDPEVGAIVGHFHDITERKEAEERVGFLSEASKLLASSLDYQTTLTTIAQLVVPLLADWCTIYLVDHQGQIQLLDIAHIDPDKVQWAKQLRESYPIDPQAPIGAPQVIRTGKSELIADIPDALLVAVAKNEEELHFLRLVGYRSLMMVPLIAAGRVIGAITFVSAESGRRFTASDLSLAEEVGLRAGAAIEHAQLYQEVQQARDQLTIILQGVADGIIVYDQHNQVIYANEMVARMMGMPSVQAILDTPSDTIFARYTLVDEQGQPITLSQLPHRRVLAGEQREAEALVGYRAAAAGEAEFWTLSRARPVFDEQGKVIFVISILHDLTGRVLDERRKDAFLAMVSHELKTPVTSLKGLTQVLSLRLANHPEAQVGLFLERMDTQLTKLTRLINDLLTLSQMQAGDLSMREEVFDLDALIRETMEQVQATTTTHHLQLQGAASVKVTGDRERLAQVLINLLTNAIRYSPRTDRVLVRVQADQSQAEIAVQDFGIGIDQTHHERIFERFYQVPDQTERTFPGMGIGLYLARTITERHGGRIWVESRKGKGSTFRVKLPLVKGEQIDMPDRTLREKREVER